MSVAHADFKRANFRRALRQGVRAERQSPRIWRSPSTSTAGRFYVVKAEWRGGSLHIECACKAGRSSKGCKHGARVLQLIQGDPWVLYAVECLSEGKHPDYHPHPRSTGFDWWPWPRTSEEVAA